jgi:hypothetical protein
MVWWRFFFGKLIYIFCRQFHKYFPILWSKKSMLHIRIFTNIIIFFAPLHYLNSPHTQYTHNLFPNFLRKFPNNLLGLLLSKNTKKKCAKVSMIPWLMRWQTHTIAHGGVCFSLVKFSNIIVASPQFPLCLSVTVYQAASHPTPQIIQQCLIIAPPFRLTVFEWILYTRMSNSATKFYCHKFWVKAKMSNKCFIPRICLLLIFP